MMTMLRMLARARRVAGWMPMILFARCHALMGAPRPTHCVYSAAGRDFVQRGPWHVARNRGTACGHPTQLAIPTLTGRKRRKEGIWDANLTRDRKRPRSACSVTAERRYR